MQGPLIAGTVATTVAASLFTYVVLTPDKTTEPQESLDDNRNDAGISSSNSVEEDIVRSLNILGAKRSPAVWQLKSADRPRLYEGLPHRIDARIGLESDKVFWGLLCPHADANDMFDLSDSDSLLRVVQASNRAKFLADESDTAVAFYTSFRNKEWIKCVLQTILKSWKGEWRTANEGIQSPDLARQAYAEWATLREQNRKSLSKGNQSSPQFQGSSILASVVDGEQLVGDQVLWLEENFYKHSFRPISRALTLYRLARVSDIANAVLYRGLSVAAPSGAPVLYATSPETLDGVSEIKNLNLVLVAVRFTMGDKLYPTDSPDDRRPGFWTDGNTDVRIVSVGFDEYAGTMVPVVWATASMDHLAWTRYEPPKQKSSGNSSGKNQNNRGRSSSGRDRNNNRRNRNGN